DHDLAHLPAVGKRNYSARNGDQLGAQEIETEIVELCLGKSLAGKPELKDRNTRGAVVDHERRQGAGRKAAQRGLRECSDLGVRGVQACLRLKEDLDDRLAIDGGRFNVLDVVHESREATLVRGGEA